MSFQYSPLEIGDLKPLNDTVLVIDMNFGERRHSSGLILRSDDGKGHGIRPRWGQVYAVGPGQKDVKVGEWILVAHGRWTRGVKIQEKDSGQVHTIRKVDNNDILATAPECPSDDTIGDGI